MSKKIIFAIVATAGLIGTSQLKLDISGNLKSLTNLQSGIQTCFKRVNQSYTAKLLGQSGSGYLTKSFMSLSEECFSDVISQLNEKFDKKTKGINKTVNALASDVHWFHKRLTQSGGSKFSDTITEANITISNIGGRFEKLENKLEKLSGKLNSQEIIISSSERYIEWAFFGLCGLLPFLLIWEFSSQRRRGRKNKEIELQAAHEVDEDRIDNRKIEAIIRKALESNQLHYCSELFSKYYTFTKERMNQKSISGEIGSLYHFATADTLGDEEVIDSVWSEGRAINADKLNGNTANLLDKLDRDQNLEKVRLNLVLANTVDLYSKKIFSKGITLDFNVEDEIIVLGEKEGVEQIVYQAIASAVNSCVSSGQTKKKIQINTQILGGSILFEVVSSGNGHSSELLKSQDMGEDISSYLSMEHLISKELVEEFNGSLTLKNELDEAGRTQGQVTQIVFRKAAGTSVSQGQRPRLGQKKRVVQLVKGKKRDILAGMQ